MQLLKEWSTLQTVWGVPSAQPVSGSSLELIEKRREKSSDGATIIHYNFKAKGLPQDATYVMEYWPVGGPSHPFQKIANGMKINADGLVVCSPYMTCGDKNQPEYPLEVAIPRTAKGDTHRFVLTSEKDHKVWVTGIATPFPIRSASESCQLEIVRMNLNGEMLILSGSGFPANKGITIQGNSAREGHMQTVETDAQGHFQLSELPFVAGKNFGTLELQVTQGADCHPSIAVEWGQGSHKFQ